MSQYRMGRREVSIPEEDESASGSEGSDINENDSVRAETKRRPSRISFSKLWKFSVLSVSPSPRVSTIDGPLAMYGTEGLNQSLRIEKRKVNICCALVMILFVIAFASTSLSIYLVTRTPPIPYCSHDETAQAAPSDQNNPDVFDDITMLEYEEVTAFLINYHHLNIVPSENATLTDSYIFLIELFLPVKKEVLQYLDEGSKQPDRKAKVVIYRGDKYPPVVEEYLVFPLPEPTEAVLYRDPAYRRYPIPFNSRPICAIEQKLLYSGILLELTETLYPLLIRSYNLCYHNCTQGQNCMEIIIIGPANDGRKTWMASFRSVEGLYVHPLGFEFLINHESTNSSEWSVERIIYNGEAFTNVTVLMNAYLSKELDLIHYDRSDNDIYSYMQVKETLPPGPKQGPFSFGPDGKRFSVKGQEIFYNMWSFRYHFRPSTGLMLFDVKVNGIRMAYEISLQEVLVFYSGYGAAHSTVSNYDVSWLLGSSTVELVRGVDCPDSAVYLDTTIWTKAGRMGNIRNNICVFENNAGKPLRRRFAKNKKGSYDYYAGITDYHLVIRSTAVVMNYDYIFDYVFYANGAIEVKAYATGYVQGTFRLFEENNYGSVVHDHVIATAHQHVFNYKVDLDIAGTNNRYSTLKMTLETIEDPLMKGANRTEIQMKQTLHVNESEITNYDFKNQADYLIHNADAKDAYFEDRAYKIAISSPLDVLKAEYPVCASFKWVNNPLIVTKRKDTEQISTSIYAMEDLSDPVLDFEDYVNGESLVDTDLVAWVTAGWNHIPSTEDIPGTSTTRNQISITITPHNYFTKCPSIHSTDNVYIRPSMEHMSEPEVNTYGRSYDAKCVPKVHGPYDFNGTNE